MKLFNLAVVILAVLAMFLGSTDANPKGGVSAAKKGVKAVKAGVGVVTAIGTGREIYDHVKNKKG